MTADEIQTIAESFFAAIESGDVDAARAGYAPDARIWHNFDQVDQTVDENLRTLKYLVRSVSNRRYEEIRRVVLDDGFVQQHVLRGDAPGGALEMPAMIRVWVDAAGKISRVEEYLDTAQAQVLSTPRPTDLPA